MLPKKRTTKNWTFCLWGNQLNKQKGFARTASFSCRLGKKRETMSKLLSQTIYDCLVGAPEADKFAQSPDPSVFQPVSQTSLLRPIGLAPIGGIVTFDFSTWKVDVLFFSLFWLI
jgi:hypothetical protein